MHDAGEANRGAEDEKPERASEAERPTWTRQAPVLVVLPDAVLRIGNVKSVVQPVVEAAIGSEGREDRPGEDRSKQVVDRLRVGEVPVRRLVQQRLTKRILTRTDNKDGKRLYWPAYVRPGSGNSDRSCNDRVLSRDSEQRALGRTTREAGHCRTTSVNSPSQRATGTACKRPKSKPIRRQGPTSY